MRIPHMVIVKAPGLLPMLYTVRELARELQLPDRTLRDWLSGGAPHSRDERNHIWINGRQFAQWVKKQQRPKHEHTTDQELAHCFRCKAAVKMTNPHLHHIKGKLFHIKGTCPQCGTTIR